MATEQETTESTKHAGPTRKRFSRRDFLKAGAATVTVATISGVMACAKAPAPAPAPAPTQTAVPAPEVYEFFNQDEAATVKAIFGQLIPGSAQDPGAVEAGAHIYLDHALAGHYLSQQAAYRRGLAAVNAYSQTKYGSPFVKIDATQQAGVITDMQGGTATGFSGPSAAAFFATLLQHAKEGTFCDPVYGGNQNFAGWKMIGFPGGQLAYGDADMVVGADQSKKQIMGLADMESTPMPSPNSGF